MAEALVTPAEYAKEWQRAALRVLEAQKDTVGLSYSDLAARTSMSRPTVYRYIRGVRAIPLPELVELCAVLGLTIEGLASKVTLAMVAPPPLPETAKGREPGPTAGLAAFTDLDLAQELVRRLRRARGSGRRAAERGERLPEHDRADEHRDDDDAEQERDRAAG